MARTVEKAGKAGSQSEDITVAKMVRFNFHFIQDEIKKKM